MGLPILDTVISDADLTNAGYITEELKPCPYCGNKTILTAGIRNERTGNIVYKAWCSNGIKFDCGASISVCIGKEDKIKESRQLVVQRWNKRV